MLFTVAPSTFETGSRNVRSSHCNAGVFTRQGHPDTSRSGSDLQNLQALLFNSTEKTKGRLHKKLGFRPGDEYGWGHRKFPAIELLDALVSIVGGSAPPVSGATGGKTCSSAAERALSGWVIKKVRPHLRIERRMSSASWRGTSDCVRQDTGWRIGTASFTVTNFASA